MVFTYIIYIMKKLIEYNAINNKERPNYLSRRNNSSGSLDELPKPKFTRSVKGKPC